MNPDQEPARDASRNDPLDELLRAATWPEPQSEQVARLEQRWRRLRATRSHRRRLKTAACLIAAAASLLIAVLLWPVLYKPPLHPRRLAPAQPQTEPAQVPARRTAQTPGPPVEPSHEKKPDDGAKPSPGEVVPDGEKSLARSRPASDYEKLVFHVLTQRRRSSSRQRQAKRDREDAAIEPRLARSPRRADGAAGVAEHPRASPDLLDAVLERVGTAQDMDLGEAAKPLFAARSEYEELLVEEIRRSHGPRQLAAIGLLGRIGTPRSVPVLGSLAARPETHAAAVRALARLADSDVLGQLAAGEADETLRQELLAELVARGDSRSVAIYLRFVQERQTSRSALAALDRVAEPPVPLLFEFLESPQQPQRLAAAVALGRIDGPEVSRRLIDMVLSDFPCREALVALVASSGPEPSRFVSQARSDPLLAGSVRSIEHRLKAFLP